MTEQFSDQQIAAGRRLFSGPCDFMLGVVATEGLPPPDVPEVAFAGRSNVGKSSLVNALTNRNALARTSNTPGRTRELNFFDLGGAIRLVDLPGYGYAKASRSDVSAWTGLTRAYLKGRATLRRAFVLIDSRHGLKPVDHETMAILDDSAVTYQIVLTKIDKIKESALNPTIEAVRAGLAKHPAAFPEIVATSSAKKHGIEALRTIIWSLSNQN